MHTHTRSQRSQNARRGRARAAEAGAIAPGGAGPAPPPTCMERTVSSRCSVPPRASSGSSTEALGSGKCENLPPTSNSRRRSLARSCTRVLEHRERSTGNAGASFPGAAPTGGLGRTAHGGHEPGTCPAPAGRGRCGHRRPSRKAQEGLSSLLPPSRVLPAAGGACGCRCGRGCGHKRRRKGRDRRLPLPLGFPLGSRHSLSTPGSSHRLPCDRRRMPPINTRGLRGLRLLIGGGQAGGGGRVTGRLRAAFPPLGACLALRGGR